MVSRFRPFASSDAAAIDKAVAPAIPAGYFAIHDIRLVTGRIDHVVAGPSGIYVLQPNRVKIARDVAKKKVLDASAQVRRQLAASGTTEKVMPVIVPMGGSGAKEISEKRDLCVVDISSLADWLKGRKLRLEPLVIEEVRSALAPFYGKGTWDNLTDGT